MKQYFAMQVQKQDDYQYTKNAPHKGGSSPQNWCTTDYALRSKRVCSSFLFRHHLAQTYMNLAIIRARCKTAIKINYEANMILLNLICYSQKFLICFQQTKSHLMNGSHTTAVHNMS